MDICDNLVNELKRRKAVKFGEFVLASGKKSRYYIDIKKAYTDPKVLRLISHCMTKTMMIHGIDTDYVACTEIGGIPIGTAVSLETNKPLIIVRKEEKDHGTKEAFIGDFKKDKSAVFVEDVVTTGSSVMRAAQVLRNKGLTVHNVITVVNRKEGSDMLFKEGLILRSIIKLERLVSKNIAEEI